MSSVREADGSERTINRGGTVATITEVSRSITVVTLLAANATRRGFGIQNDANANLYIKHGSGASLTNFSAVLAPGALYTGDRYLGVITGIWSGQAGGGKARITEVTP